MHGREGLSQGGWARVTAMLIICPHCQNSQEVAESATREEVSCTSCGSSFRLERGTTTDWKPAEKRRLGKFELLETLGQGASGTVYEARDPELDRVVAIKVLRSGHLASDEELDRFLREARSVGQFRHPCIVSVYEVGQADHVPYLVCELVKGVTLADLMSSRRLRPAEAAELGAALADALHYAHERGVIHRDVKPANIMVDEKQVPRLMDFGLAKRDLGDVTMTVDGQVLGTPAYMSPEQARGQSHQVDGRSDVYSLGVVLYQMLTDELPFRGTPRMLLHQVLNDEPRRPRSLNENIPRDLDTICLKAMAKEPARRYGSAADLAEDLRRFLRGEPIRARPLAAWETALNWARRRPAVAGLLAASTIAALALVAVVLGTFHSARLGTEKLRAEAARDSAERSRLGEEEQRRIAERYLYFSRIGLAEREWSANNIGRALQLLSECPAELRGWEWNYLKRMCHTELQTIAAHTQQMPFVVFSPDGKRLVTSSWDKTMKVWNADAAKELRALPLREIGQSASFSPKGDRLALGFWVSDSTHPAEIDVIDTATWKPLRSLRGHDGAVYGIAIDPTGRHIASAGQDRAVRVWEVSSGAVLHTFRSEEAPFSAVAFNHDGRILAGGIGDVDEIPLSRVGKVMLWDVGSGQTLHTLTGHEGAVATIAIRPDGDQLASGSRDQTIRIWEVKSGKLLRILRGHTSRISWLRYNARGDRIASCSHDGSVRMWDAESGQLLRTLRGHTGPVNCLAFNPTGDRLASAGIDGKVKLWNPDLDPDARQVSLGATLALNVSFSPDGKRLAVCGSEGTMKVFDPLTGKELLRSRGHSQRVWRYDFSPDGSRLVSAGEDATGRVWDAVSGNQIALLKGHTRWLQGAAFSPDNRRIATASGDQTVKLWDAATGKETRTLAGHTECITSLAFHPSGKYLISGSSDKTVKIWDPMTGENIGTLAGHTDEIQHVAFSADGQLIASAGGDLSVKVWDFAERKSMLTLLGHTGYIFGVAFSPDGKRLASASLDQTVKIWDLSAGQELITLRAQTGGFQSVTFSPDGKQIAAAGHDGTVRIWDATPSIEAETK